MFELFKYAFEKGARVTITNKELGQPLRGSSLGPRPARINTTSPSLDPKIWEPSKTPKSPISDNVISTN